MYCYKKMIFVFYSRNKKRLEMPVFLKTSRILSFISLANENKNKIRFRILISLLYIWSELKLCLGSYKVSELKLRLFLKYFLYELSNVSAFAYCFCFNFFFHLSCPSELRGKKKSFNITEKNPKTKQNRKIF